MASNATAAAAHVVHGANGTSTPPKLTLYTNHRCPWAHRVHITLKALGLQHEEVVISLDRPRDEWYLKEVNARGLVPAIKIESSSGKQYVLTESAIIVHFLVDLAHSLPDPYSSAATSLVPPPTSLERSLRRAAINFFVDTFISKLNPLSVTFYRGPAADDPKGPEAEEAAGKIVEVIRRELEPLLVDAKPFFGESPQITLVEALVGSFVLRFWANVDDAVTSEAPVFPPSLSKSLTEVAPRFTAWSEAVRKSEVVQAGIWDEKVHLERLRERINKNKSKA